MSPEEKVQRTAGRQFGLLTREQLIACGFTSSQISRRCSGRGWARVLPGVYRLPGSPNTFEARMTAARLWLREDEHFSGETAAHIYKLDGVGRPERVTVSCRRRFEAPPWLAITKLAANDRPRSRSVGGYRVPTVERVLIDLAASTSPKSVGLALDDALRRKMTTVEKLRTWLEENGGRGKRGTKLLKEVLRGRDELDERTRSQFETEMLRILRRIPGITIEPNQPFQIGKDRYIVDFYLVEPDLGIECHSSRHHDGERIQADAVRHRRIGSTGTDLLYFGWDETHFDPRGIEQEIAAAIARRLQGR